MKLIIGLGNPGNEYSGTRHNFGFMAADYLHDKFSSNQWQSKTRFSGLIAEAVIANEKVILLKPTTFYNLVGTAALAVKQFYKLDTGDILVIHDEMALPLGTVRSRIGGSDAGNNGIKNLIATIGADFARIRIGSGLPPKHDGDAQPTHDRRDYVLQKISPSDQALLRQELPIIAEWVTRFTLNEFQTTTYRVQ